MTNMTNESVGRFHYWIHVHDHDLEPWRELETKIRARSKMAGTRLSESNVGPVQTVFWAGFDALHQNFDDAFLPALSHMLDTARVLAARRAKMEGGN